MKSLTATLEKDLVTVLNSCNLTIDGTDERKNVATKKGKKRENVLDLSKKKTNFFLRPKGSIVIFQS